MASTYCPNCKRQIESRWHVCAADESPSPRRARGKESWEQSEREMDEAIATPTRGAAPVLNDLAQLTQLMRLDRLPGGEPRFSRPVLDDTDLRIIEAALHLLGVKHKTIARELGMSVNTVRKRVKAMRGALEATKTRLTPPPINDRDGFDLFKRLVIADAQDDQEELEQLVMQQAWLAHSMRSEASRDGVRCRACSKRLKRSAGRGRPRRYCNERCRDSYRRAVKKGGK